MSDTKEEKTEEKKRNRQKKTDRLDDGLTGWLVIDLLIDGVVWVFRGFGKALDAVADLFD